MAWCCVALHDISVRVYQYCQGVPAAFVAWACISPWGAFQGHLRAVLAVSLHIRRVPAHVLMALAWLSVQCGGVHVLSSISPPSSPYLGE